MCVYHNEIHTMPIYSMVIKATRLTFWYPIIDTDFFLRTIKTFDS